MPSLPRVTESDFVERAGVIEVAAIVNRARCVWRETVRRDIGIDGHIEYVTPDGFAPGRLVGVQVKSGESRFANANANNVPFRPEEKHRRYWVGYPVPVILILHHPGSAETIWADARASLRVDEQGPVVVPRHQQFDDQGVIECLRSEGPLPEGAFDPWSVVREMAVASTGAQGLSFLHLFAQGITDVGASLYVSMDVVSETLDALAAEHSVPTFSVGENEFLFVDSFVEFLVRQDLARVDYGAWKQPHLERGMVGMFIAPLTTKGRIVRGLLERLDRALPHDPDPHAVAIRERFVQMVYNRMGYDEFGSRHKRLSYLRRMIDEGAIEPPLDAENK